MDKNDGQEVAVLDLIDQRVKAQMDAGFAEVQRKYSGLFQEKAERDERTGQKAPPPGIKLARFAKCVLASQKGGDPEYWAKSIYPDDKDLAVVIKGAMSEGTPSEGGSFVPIEYAQEFIGILYDQLILTKLGARRIPMPRGNLTIPKFNTSAAAYYVGENTQATQSKPGTGDAKLAAKKLMVLVPISNDLIRDGSPEADAYVRDDIIMVSKLKRDYVAFYGLGTEHTPSGLDKFLTSSEKKGGSSTAFTADIPSELYGELLSKNVPGLNLGWAINGRTWTYLYNLKTSTGAYIYRDEMREGKLVSVPFALSNQISYTAGSPGYVDLFLGDWSEFIDGVQTDMEMEASKEASYVDSDGNTVSAFSKDQTVLRLISRHDYQIKHKESFVKGTYKLATT